MDREPLEDEGYMVVQAISDNYLHYLRDACHLAEIKKTSDMSAIYLRDNVYTNIKGGLGIFAASISDKLQWANRYTEITSAYYKMRLGDVNDNNLWSDSIFVYDW